MSGRLIALNKLSRVYPVGVGEMGAVFLQNVYLKSLDMMLLTRAGTNGSDMN